MLCSQLFSLFYCLNLFCFFNIKREMYIHMESASFEAKSESKFTGTLGERYYQVHFKNKKTESQNY